VSITVKISRTFFDIVGAATGAAAAGMTVPPFDPTTVRNKLRAFICTDLLRHPSYPLADDEPLITGGLIDSFCVAYLGVFIEDAFQVYIPDVDLTVENMDTLQLISARVLQR
jgi:acyl carrier protein